MSPPAKKSGMSAGVKIVLGLFAAGMLAVVLGCGGLWWFANGRVTATKDPEQVRQLSQSIAEVDVPEGFVPKLGLSMKLGFRMQTAVFDRGRQPGDFVLMQMTVPGENANGPDPEFFDQQMQSQGHDKDFKVQSTETKKVEIEGQERDFEFANGASSQGAAMRRVKGTFPGRDGLAYIQMTLPEAGWDEAQVTHMLESIRTK